MKEVNPVFFKYLNESNGYLYFLNLINKRYNVKFNDFTLLKLSHLPINCHILNYENYYFIDFKRIKYVEHENLFEIIDNILIRPTASYKIIKYDYKVLLFMNLNYINENYISRLTNITEKNSILNNFVFFSTKNKINNIKFKKLLLISDNYFLKPEEFIKDRYSKNEKIIAKMLNFDIYKTNILIHNLKNNYLLNSPFAKKKVISRYTKKDIYNIIIEEISLYKIINKYLLKNELFEIIFKLISVYNPSLIISYTLNLIKYVNFNQIKDSKLYFTDNKNEKLLKISMIESNNQNNLLLLKQFFSNVHSIYNC